MERRYWSETDKETAWLTDEGMYHYMEENGLQQDGEISETGTISTRTWLPNTDVTLGDGKCRVWRGRRFYIYPVENTGECLRAATTI